MRPPGKIHFKFRDLFEVTGEGALGVFVVAGLALIPITALVAVTVYLHLN